MVSNDEIKHRLNTRKAGTGYLICDECQGFYELQTGEKSEDFSDECECGGKLKFSRTSSNLPLNKDSRNKKLVKKGIIVFIVLIGLAIFILPYAYIFELSQISSNNLNTNNNGQNYDRLATLKSDYNTLNDDFTSTQTQVDASNNQNIKTAFSSAKLDLVKANSDISDVDSALSAGKSQDEVTQKITTAQSQLNTAKVGLAKVKGMI